MTTISAAPRSRAGNAMERTRSGIVAGARAAIVRDGVRRLSMARVADLGGIAKATVYNHVRSKPQLLGLVAHDLLDRVVAAALDAAPPGGHLAFSESLVAAGRTAARDDVVRAVADKEPVVVGKLLRVIDTEVWDPVRDAISVLAVRHDVVLTPDQSDLIVRWLITLAVAPGDVDDPDTLDTWRHQAAALVT